MKLGSSFAVLLILLGGLTMAFSYPTVLNCLSATSNDPHCWSILPSQNRNSTAALGLYFGVTSTVLGTMILAGPTVANLFRRLKGADPTPNNRSTGS